MVGFGGLEEVYTSRVVGKPFESVTVSLHLLHQKDERAKHIGYGS